MNKLSRFGPRRAGALVVILIAVLFLAAGWVPDSPAKSSPGSGNGFSGWGCPPGRNFRWYVSQGQWKADARTALGILQYVLSPDLDAWTSPVAPHPAPFLSATTNSVTKMPNV